MNNAIGKKLKSLRKEKGLSQEQVCEYLHISQSSYSRMENGESTSWVIHIEKISSLYNIKPEELIKNENLICSDTDSNKSVGFPEMINLLSEQLIEQYKFRLEEKEKIIVELRAKLNKLGAN